MRKPSAQTKVAYHGATHDEMAPPEPSVDSGNQIKLPRNRAGAA